MNVTGLERHEGEFMAVSLDAVPDQNGSALGLRVAGGFWEDGSVRVQLGAAGTAQVIRARPGPCVLSVYEPLWSPDRSTTDRHERVQTPLRYTCSFNLSRLKHHIASQISEKSL